MFRYWSIWGPGTGRLNCCRNNLVGRRGAASYVLDQLQSLQTTTNQPNKSMRSRPTIQEGENISEIRACLVLPGLPPESPSLNTTWQQCITQIQELKKIANPYRPLGPTIGNLDEEDDDNSPADPVWLWKIYADVFNDKKAQRSD